MTNEKKLAACLVGLLFLLLVFYGPFILGSCSFYYADTTFWLEPQARLLTEAIRSGRFPLWNPWNYCGMPQIANSFPSLFYLPDLLLVLLPFSCGLALSMVFHQSLSAVGMYLLLRSFKLPCRASATGALLYSLSGYMFCLSSNHSLVAGAAWFPLTLWALKEIDTPGEPARFRRCLTGSLFIVLLFTSGRPEVTAPSLALILCYFAGSTWRQFQLTKSFDTDVFVWRTRALFLGFVFCLPALLPMAEWLSVSRRAGGLLPQEFFLNSANWYDMIIMITGLCLGDVRLHGAPFRALVTYHNLSPYVSCAYIGPLAFTLALWGAFRSHWRLRGIILFILMIGILASMGDNTPVAPLMVQLCPVLSFVRFPIKLLFLVVWCAAILAAQGMISCEEGKVPVRASGSVWVAIACGSLLLISAASSGHLLLQFPYSVTTPAIMIQAQAQIGYALLLSAAVGVLLCALATAANKEQISRKHFTAGLIICLSGTLLWYAFTQERSGAPNDFFSTASFTAEQIKDLRKQEELEARGKHQGASSPLTKAAVGSSRVLGLTMERLTTPDSYLRGDAQTNSIALFQYLRQLLRPDTNIDEAIAEAFGFEGSMSGDYYYSVLHAYFASSQTVRPEVSTPSEWPLARICALTATDLAITQCYRRIGKNLPVPVMDGDFFQPVVNDVAMNVRIYKVVNPMPRCYLSHSWRWAATHNEVLNKVVSIDKSAWVPWETSLLEAPAGAEQPPEPSPGAHAARFETAQIVIDEPETVEIHVNARQSGPLILADRAYAGWEAELDGMPAPLYLANGFTRAVFVPAGVHTVRFQYHPGSLRLGLLLAGLGLLLLAYLGWQAYQSNSSDIG